MRLAEESVIAYELSQCIAQPDVRRDYDRALRGLFNFMDYFRRLARPL